MRSIVLSLLRIQKVPSPTQSELPFTSTSTASALDAAEVQEGVVSVTVSERNIDGPSEAEERIVEDITATDVPDG